MARKKVSDINVAIVEAIGPRIVALRLARDMSQAQLARVSCVSQRALTDCERGVSVPSVTTLVRVANALEVPFTELLVTP